jgi:hypothetical protein
MYRTAIDLGQNAVELVLKTLILVKGEVDREMITRVYRALELRNKEIREIVCKILK